MHAGRVEQVYEFQKITDLPYRQQHHEPGENKGLDNSHIYTPILLSCVVDVPIDQFGKNMRQYITEYLESTVVGKCSEHGYMTPKTCKVISLSAPLCKHDSLRYSVVYSVNVCYPHLGMTVNALVTHVVPNVGLVCELGIKTPMVIYVAIEKEVERHKVGERLRLKLFGHRFESGDRYITALGRFL
jgi:DNA-directed RNA polymerase subunit E'/Rpb7